MIGGVPNRLFNAERMYRVPYPLLDGSDTGGPPLSTHSRVSRSASCETDHCKLIRPSGWERAPYLSALVANSWRQSASVVAASGRSRTVGPVKTRRSVPFALYGLRSVQRRLRIRPLHRPPEKRRMYVGKRR